MQQDGEKTEEPTAKKLQEAHSRGQFAKSQEIGTTLLLGSTIVILAFAGKEKAAEVGRMAIGIFSSLHDIPLDLEGAVILLQGTTEQIFLILLPLFIASMIAAVAAGGMQSSFKLTPKAMEAKLDKLDPVKGFGKIFNKRNLVQLLVDLLKLSVLMGILYGLISRVMNDPIFSSPVPAEYIGGFLFDLFIEMLTRLLIALSAIAAIDYLWQKRKTHEELKMTKQEVKDELRQSEGDPHVKAQQRRMSRQLMQKQMTQAVPTADVVVTNPTHFAVALKYEQGKDLAPVVIAKGQGAFARHLKKIAKEHDVPMVENVPLARVLYKVGQVGKTIPLELYEVVARLLANVYRTHRYYFHRLRARRMSKTILA